MSNRGSKKKENHQNLTPEMMSKSIPVPGWPVGFLILSITILFDHTPCPGCPAQDRTRGDWNHVIFVMILVPDSPMAKTPSPFRESSPWDRAAAETNPKDPNHLITLVLPSLADRVDTYGLLRGDYKVTPNSHSFTQNITFSCIEMN